MSAVAPSTMINDAAAHMMVPRGGGEEEEPRACLRSLLDAPSKSSYDNSAVRRRLSAGTTHRRGSAEARKLESFASEKFPFAFFNTDDNQDQPESVHPLFAALALGATQDVVHHLYEACPKALGETTRSGLTPLHLACKYGASARVVEFLLHHCPSHASRKTKTTWSTPLHLAAATGGCAEVIRLLSVKSPRSVLAAQDRRGNTPLHCSALSRSSCDEVVRLLVALRRSALEMKNNMGMTPLHAACLVNTLSAGSVRLMLKSPSGPAQAASAADSHGNVALHYASSHGAAADAASIRALLEAAPACSAAKNKMGHLPLDVAKFDASTPASVVSSIETAVRLTTLKDDGDAAELHTGAIEQGWARGADMILDARPGLVHRLNLDERVLPRAVSKVKRRSTNTQNNLGAIFEMVKGMPHLVGR